MTRTETAIRKAKRDFLNSKANNLKDSTVRAYRIVVSDFINYCETNGIEAVGNIDGYLIEQWKIKRKDEDQVSPATLKNNLKHLRVFIRWCEATEMLDAGMADKIQIPSITDAQERSDDIVNPEQMQSILNHLEMYQYATRLHAFTKLLWHIGCRISVAIALDVQDFRPRKGVIEIRNREQTGTGLKNGNKSERNVTLNDDVVEVLNDYVNGHRLNVTDDHGREPLFTTEAGRMGRNVAYKNFVAISRPCVYDNYCPHNRNVDNCEAAQKKKRAFDCPSSESLHPIRRGSITYHLNQGWPIEQVSQRCDVGVDVLKKHYDSRSLEDTRQQRSQHLDKL